MARHILGACDASLGHGMAAAVTVCRQKDAEGELAAEGAHRSGETSWMARLCDGA